MTKAENRTFLSHLWAELWCTKPSQEKKLKKFCQRFFFFSFAVIAIENDDEGRKHNFSISPMGGVMVYQTLPAEKMKIFLSKIFFVLVWLSSLEKTMANFPISRPKTELSYLTYGRSYGVPNPSSRKNEKIFVKDFLAHLSRRLTGELIVYPCSGVRPSVLRPSFTFSKIFFSETAWPIKAKLHVEHP